MDLRRNSLLYPLQDGYGFGLLFPLGGRLGGKIYSPAGGRRFELPKLGGYEKIGRAHV